MMFGWAANPTRTARGLGRRGGTFRDRGLSTSEVRVSAGSPYIGQTVRDVEKHGGGDVTIAAIDPRPWNIGRAVPKAAPGGSTRTMCSSSRRTRQALELVARDGKLELVGGEEAPATVHGGAEDDKKPAKGRSAARAKPKSKAAAQPKPPTKTRKAEDEGDDRRGGRLTVVEAVVGVRSPLIGQSAETLRLRERHGVNVLAISRSGRRSSARLRRARFQLGDAVVLQGDSEHISEILARLGCLPLAERQLKLGRPRQLLLPLGILAVTMIVTGFEWVPVEIAFVAAAVMLVLFRLVSLDEAYEAIDWPILILLGSLIPIGEAVKTTGTADLIAGVLSGAAAHAPVFAVVGAVLTVTMLVTPVLHHAAAVLVMGPIAASLAQRLGFQIDPFLMAVAVGAGSDFLSPIGHQSNTLVMGLGGYRFGDYWKLGLPLSILVIVLGTPLILLFWPLH